MNTKTLRKMGACMGAVAYAAGERTQQEAWDNCERGDWLLWILGKRAGPVGSKSRKKLAMVCAQVAKLALPYSGTNRVVCERTIQTVLDYHNATATIEQIKEAAAEANAAANVAAEAAAEAGCVAYDASAAANTAAEVANAAADAAAEAAVEAGCVAYDASAAAEAAAEVAEAAADAAYATAARAFYEAEEVARSRLLATAAEAVRTHYPQPPRLK